MAEQISMKIGIDSRSAKTAANDLNNFARSASNAEGSTDRLSASQKRLQDAFRSSNTQAIKAAQYIMEIERETKKLTTSAYDLKKYEIAMRAAKAPTLELKKAIREAGAEHLRAMKQIERGTPALTNMGKSGKLATHHMTNLSFQLQDIFIGLQGGQKPMTVFLQQGSQIGQIMMQAGVGVGALASAVAGMVASITKAILLNPYFLAIAATIGTVSAALNMMASDINKTSKVTVTASDVMLGAFDVLRDTIKNQVSNAFKALGIDAGQAWDTAVKYTRKAINIILGLVSLIPRGIAKAFKVVPLMIEDIMAGDFSKAFSRAMSAVSEVGTDTFERDFIGDIGSVLKDAAINRAVQRQAKEAGKKIGKNLADGLKEVWGDALNAMAKNTAEISKQLGMEIGKEIDKRLAADEAAFQERIERSGYAIVQNAKDEVEQRQKNNDELEKTASYLDDIFGLNGNLGKLFGALRKGFGDLFDKMTDQFLGLKESINGFLQGFGTNLKQIGAGMAAGGAAAGLTGGSQTGGMIGGALGTAIGEKVLGSLGKFAGPLGSIAGGLLGGLIGGMFSSTPKAAATVKIIGGEAMISGVTGNKSRLKKIATGMAGALIDGLENLADELGGFLGEMAGISIGIRKKTYRVDVTGRGRTKNMPAFETEQEAIAYAMKYAIDNGVIEGIRQSTQNLLRAGDDLQAALEDAFLFESVFDRLLEATDPLAYGLQQLEKEFTKLRKVFDAAGATAEEYADLEALYQIERQKVLDENNKVEEQALNLAQLNIRLLETEGKALEALAATRQAELDAATEAEQAILRLIYAQEDLNDVLVRSAQVRENIANLEIRLLELQGRTAEATASRRAQELAAAADTEKVVLRQIYLLEDLNAKREEELRILDQAESNLRAVYEREKATFEETAQKFRDLASALREFSDTIFNTTKNPIQSLQSLERQFFATAKQARLGDTAALEALPSLGANLRDAVVDTASSRVEMIRKLAAIQRETDAAAEVAERQADNAMTQLEALNAQVGLLIDINDNVMSVDEAIREYLAARESVAATNAAITAAGGVAVGPTTSQGGPAQQYAQKYFENVPNIGDIGLAMRYMSTLATQLVNQYGMPVSFVQSAHYAAQRAYSNPTATSADIANAFKNTIGFANGGMHSGGLRIVGENGPELEATGASRIYNANQLGSMIGGNGAKEEIKSLREEMRAALFQIAKNTGKTSDQLNRWDGDGLPSTRTWDAA